MLSGGVRSGFHHPEPDAPRPPKLYQVTADAVVEVRLPVTHLEDGDVYVYEAGGDAGSPPSVMQYNSKSSHGKVKFKGAEVARETAGELGEVQVYGKSHSLSWTILYLAVDRRGRRGCLFP